MSNRNSPPQDIGAYVAGLEERIRRLENSVSGISPQHGLLEGLPLADDHPQYLLKDYGRVSGDLLVFDASQQTYVPLATGQNGTIPFSNDQAPHGLNIQWRELGLYYEPWELTPPTQQHSDYVPN